MHLPRSTRVLALVVVALTLTGLGAVRCEPEPRTATVQAAAATAPAGLPHLRTWWPPPTTTTTRPPPPPTTAPHPVQRHANPPKRRSSAPTSSKGHWHPGGPCPSPSQCPQLRQCENGGSYGHGTSPGFDGAYQFGDKGVWGMTPADQDAHADAMYADRGADPWPTCGRYLR